VLICSLIFIAYLTEVS